MASKFPINNQPWLISDLAGRIYGDHRPKPGKPTLSINEKILVDTHTLAQILSCGKKTAVEIGHRANACVKIGRKLFWNTSMIREYVDDIAR